jgi:hypothetical protein
MEPVAYSLSEAKDFFLKVLLVEEYITGGMQDLLLQAIFCITVHMCTLDDYERA